MKKFIWMFFGGIILLAGFSFAHADVITQNLIQNGDFVKTGIPLPGWTINLSYGERYKLTSDSVMKKALEITMPVAGSATVISSPGSVSGGAFYLLTFWYHANGMSTKGETYQGCNAYVSIIWKNKTGKEIKNTGFGLPYGPIKDYQPATFTAAAPEGAVKVVITFNLEIGEQYKGPTTSIFIDDVRLMKLTKISIPVKAKKWIYLQRELTAGLKIVKDKDAEQKRAIISIPDVTPQYTTLTGGRFTNDQSIGEYEVIFRLKVKNNTIKEPVCDISANDIGSLNYDLTKKTLFATDFKQAGVYQNFPIVFVRPEAGVVAFRVTYLGGMAPALSYDKKTVIQIKSFNTDNEQFTIWFGKINLNSSPVNKFAYVRNRILVIAGLGNTIYLPSKSLSKNFTLKYLYLADVFQGFVLDKSFPLDLKKLRKVKIIIMTNVPAGALNGMLGRLTLLKFIRQGGGLIYFGGPLALGKGDIRHSLLKPVLPITTMGPWDMIKSPGVIKVSGYSWITAGLDWNQKPYISYLQKVIPKSGSTTLLKCNGLPILITGRYGKGKVAVFTGTYFNNPSKNKNQVFFYKWKDYTELLNKTINWLINY